MWADGPGVIKEENWMKFEWNEQQTINAACKCVIIFIIIPDAGCPSESPGVVFLVTSFCFAKSWC